MNKTVKRFAAAALAIIMVAGAVPANFGQVKLFDTAVVASAEGLVDTSETTKQNDESDYFGFNTNGIYLNLYGKDGETTIQTTYGNTGFTFYIAVSDDGVNYTEPYTIYDESGLKLGKVYDFSTELGVKVKISAELVNGGKTVKLDYDVENTSETKKYIKIGSFGDTQLTTLKRLEANDRDGDDVAVTKTASGITLSNEDLKFDIALSDVNDLGVWIGPIYRFFRNMFGNGVEDVDNDSAVTWHWAYELDAGKTRNTHALSGVMIATYTVAFDTNGGSTVPTQGVNEGNKAAKPDDPTKEGYTFEGWYADKELTTPFDFDSAISDNTTVYANWTKDQIEPTYAPVLAEGLTYNGSDQALVTSNGGEGGTLHYVYRKTGDTAWTAAASGFPKAVNAGTYEIGWYSEANTDYKASGSAAQPNSAGTVTIAKANITITANDKSSQYGEPLAELDYTIGGDYVESDNIGVLLSAGIYEDSDVGEYDIITGWQANSNYNATLVNGKYTITKAPLTITAMGYDAVYDGDAHGITVDVGESDAVVYYGTEELTAENYETAGSTINPEYTNAGEYTVYFYIVSKNYEADPVSGSKVVSIRKAYPEISITNNDSQPYTGEALQLIGSGKTSGGTLVYAIGDENGPLEPYTESIPTAVDAGTYYVWYMAIGDENYEDSPEIRLTAEITKVDASVKTLPTAKEDLIADGTAKELVNAGEAEGGKMMYALGDENGALEPYTELLPTAEEAGDYYVWYIAAGDDNHLDTEAGFVKVTVAAPQEDESSESTPDSSKAEESKADSSSKAAEAASTSNPATGAAVGMGAASLAAAALIVTKKKKDE